MSDSPGDVYELGGRRVGKTASLEGTFLDQARVRSGETDVYAVVGPDSSAEFRERLSAVCPVVVSEKAKGVALLVDGDPAEWGTE